MYEQLVNYIKTLIPLCEIKKENNLKDLYKNIQLGRMHARKILYRSGEKNVFTYYLLSGQLSLIDANDNKSVLKSDDPRCRFPVGYDQSHKYTVRTDTAITYLKINSETLDVLLTWDQATTPLIRRPVRNDANKNRVNWMSRILELELFQRIPPTNIQAMFLRFESIEVDKDEVVIKQDSEAAYYYVLKSGKAKVVRSAPQDDSSPVILANLAPGDAFGEDGLVANSPRNASVVMVESGELARLSKSDFIQLLKEPVVKSINYAAAQDLLKDGARLIDVRTGSEYQHNHLQNSLSIPLNTIRDQLINLEKSPVYIVYCDTGSRSEAACFILNEHGFVAFFLENGLNEVPTDAIQHPE